MKRYLKTVVGLMVLFSVMLSAREYDYASSHYKYISLYNKENKVQQMRSVMGFEDFQKIIKEQWNKGYDISDIKYGNGKWIGVFTKADRESHQTYVVSPRWSGVNDILNEYWNKGYYMTHIEHGLAEWVVVFEKNTSYTNQSYERRKTLDEFVSAVEKR